MSTNAKKKSEKTEKPAKASKGILPIADPSLIAEEEELDTEVVVKTTKETVVAKAIRERNLVVRIDDLFQTGLVYAYGDFELLSALREKIFRRTDATESATAKCLYGQTMLGGAYASVAVVWVNSERTAKEAALPSFVHEIAHVADDILEHAEVKDSSGEVRAYFIERECRIVANRLLGMRYPDPITRNKIMETLND